MIRKNTLFQILIILFLISSCQPEEKDSFKIAFGSCGHQDNDLPVFNEVVKKQPDLFVFLGDNIYGDTKDMEVLKSKYQKLANKSSYQNLKNNVRILATWDDHDYGWNDSGKEYEFKEESKKIFQDFFEVRSTVGSRTRPGIYDAYYYDWNDKKIIVILLDTRTFRDGLLKNSGEQKDDSRYFYNLDYTPHITSDSTLLGEAQWQWLENLLRKKADIRIIASSTQFGIEFNGYEAWANFPHEQKRLLETIKRTKAEGVLFISGDVHYAEISKIEDQGLYPIYDITSSGLSSTWHFATPNKNRIEGPIMENHFGMLTFKNENEEEQIVMEIWDVNGNQRIEHIVPLSELQFQ